jgi:hypothetical protein
VTATAETTAGLTAKGRREMAERTLSRLLFSAIALGLALQLHLSWITEINWDEFHYLALVHEYARGELSLALQTAHVHLFAPLLWLPGDEILQVKIGRLIMLGLQCGTMALLYRLSRRFFAPSTALLLVLAYAASGNVLMHGSSFRADPFAAFLILSGLVAVSQTRLGPLRAAVAVLAPAAALLVTVKVVFYAPAFLAVLLWQLQTAPNRLQTFQRWAAITLVSLAAFALAYWLHKGTLAAASDARSAVMLSNAAQVTLLDASLFPRARDIIRHMLQDPLQVLLWIAGAASALAAFFGKIEDDKSRAQALLLMALVAVCLVAYRNAFPYFFPFILPPAMLLIGYAIESRRASARLVMILVLALVTSAFLNWDRVRDNGQETQQAILDEVHAMYPQPVATIDRNGMIASFPRVGFFMSTWGLQNYLTAAVPVFGEILAERPVPLLVLNSPTLEDAVGEPPTARLYARLLPEDRALLRDNYIPQAGKIWVAGKSVEAGPDTSAIAIAIPGLYRLEAEFPLVINAVEVQPGHTTMLERGRTTLSSARTQSVILRWAGAGPRPGRNLPGGPVYRGL